MNTDRPSEISEGVAAYRDGDYDRAYRLLAAPAASGAAEAAYCMAEMCRWGTGAPLDAHEALRWYQMAADGGHAMAAWELSHIYGGAKLAPGSMAELPKDREKAEAYRAAAVQRFTSAANQGDADAMAMMGFLHMIGDGVPPDAREAERWLTKAVEAGKHAAANNLCLLYYESMDESARDPGKARYWYGRLKELDCQCIRIDEFEAEYE